MKNIAAIFIVLIAAASSKARTITVNDDHPADFTTIQAAIDAANNGDTIKIQPGTYTGHGNRDIDFISGNADPSGGGIYSGIIKVKVFILAGQSNMEGQGVVEMDHPEYYNSGKGNLVNTMKNPKKAHLYKHLKDEKGRWAVRSDVKIVFRERFGDLTIGYTGYGGLSHIGPELQFGHVLGDYYRQPVLLIKTAWGGKNLFKDFRPPSSSGTVGPFYTKMIEDVRKALDNMHKTFGDLAGRDYEIAGFIWMQGWNDMCTPKAIPEYAENLVNLAKDVRQEFNSPNLPVIIGELGNGGPDAKGNMAAFRKAQKEGAEKIKNATFVVTHNFARPAGESPNRSHGHHWFGNAESYFLIGDALAKAYIKLIDPKDRVNPHKLSDRPQK